jgi:hypothetical protein
VLASILCLAQSLAYKQCCLAQYTEEQHGVTAKK